MNVVYASDNNGMDLLLVSMYSILKHNKGVKFYVLQSDMTARNKALLKKLVSNKGQVITVHVDESKFSGIKNDNTILPLQSFYRLLIPELLVNQDRCLYVDIDTLCLANLSDLYEMPLDDFWVAGVNDGAIKAEQDGIFYEWYKKFAGSTTYINAGILLMNLKKLNQDNKADELLRTAKNKHKIFHKSDIYADQTVLNIILKGGIKLLPEEYNQLALAPQNYDHMPKIIHFAGHHKPFTHYDTKEEYMDIYWQYYDELQSCLPDFDDGRLIKKALFTASSAVEALNTERAELLSRIQTLQERIDLEVSELKIYRDEPNLNTSAKLLRKALRKETAAKHRQISSKVKLR
jgi:lipopolysaccharide biosynthesis glycosyltransferase